MPGADGFPGMGTNPAAFFHMMGSFFTGAYPNSASMFAAMASQPAPTPMLAAEPAPSGGIFSAAAILRAGQAATAPPAAATQPAAAGVAVGAAAAITLSGASPTQSLAEGGSVSEPTSTMPVATGAHGSSPAATSSPAKLLAPVGVPPTGMYQGAIGDGVVDVKLESTTDMLARPMQVSTGLFSPAPP
jgi:hypothetical protein